MASPYRVRAYSLLIAAGTVTPQPLGGELDWMNDGTQNRSVAISGATAGDSFTVEVTLDNGATWVTYQAASTGATNYFIKVDHPIKGLRVTKTGAAGSATVTALI